MRSATIFIVIIVLLTFFKGNRATATDPFDTENTVVGVGSMPCSEFTRVMKEGSSSEMNTWFAWAAGFESGINLAAAVSSGASFDLLPQKLPKTSQLVSLFSYCVNNPNEHFEAAAMNLFRDVKEHQ